MCLRKFLVAMGSGNSFLHRDDDDVLGTEYDSSQGVLKTIPNEVKPRPRLGGGVRSVRSISKQQKNGSLRSALSVDMENPEVEKIRKDFEMYRLSKENELTNIRKKEQKLETENRRLRAELQAKEKTCQKQKEERDSALEAEHRAQMRAAAIEHDRDKIQHLFKIFRETKESELRNLLKAKQTLESKLARLGGSAFEDPETTSRLETSGAFGNHGDWWATLDSEPSVGSLTHHHRSTFHGPEFLQPSIVDPDGLYVNINKDDWIAATATLANGYLMIPESVPSNRFVVYLTGTPDTQQELDLLCSKYSNQLRHTCNMEGHLFTLISMPGVIDEDFAFSQEKHVQARCREIDQCHVSVIFIGTQSSRFVEMDVNYGSLRCCSHKKTIVCFKDTVHGQDVSEFCELRGRLTEEGKAKVLNYSEVEEGVDLVFQEIVPYLKHISDKKERGDLVYQGVNLEEPLLDWGTAVWDNLHDFEQLEAFRSACQSTCELGFERYYERLNAHILAAGPLPPLLICGAAGSGKSLLLAKWMELQLYRMNSGSLLLYHFVGAPSSCTADPMLMIHRLTSQLMQQVNAVASLACDNSLLMEEFPKWLEKVSSRMPGGIILVIDSADRFQKVETHLKWLVDPLPVDLRVIVSARHDQIPAAWKSWPSVVLEGMNSARNVKDLLQAELSSQGTLLSEEHEDRILTHCLASPSCSPLYLILMTSFLTRCYNDRSLDSNLDLLLSTSDSTHLYQAIIGHIIDECKSSSVADLIQGVLLAVFASRNGVSEAELFGAFSELTAVVWSTLRLLLTDFLVLTLRSGLLVFAHEQAREAVAEMFLNEGDREEKLKKIYRRLYEHHSSCTRFSEVTCRTADELPWICQQLEDDTALELCLTNLSIFVKLFVRGRCFELLTYWQNLGADKIKISQSYMSAAKKLEDHCNSESVALTSVADIYEAIGRFIMNHCTLSEALNPLQRSLELRETSLDPDHPVIARSLHFLALLHERQSKLTTAEPLYKQALEIYEDSLGKEHLLVTKQLDALVLLYKKLGKNSLAEPLQKRSISVKKKLKGHLMTTMNSKATETLQKKVLELDDLTMGPPSVELARTINEIGVLHYLQGNFGLSESLLIRSLEMRSAILKEDHPDLAQSLNNLAALYNDRKLYDKASPLYERALEIRQKLFPVEHVGVTSIIKNLGILYKKTGQLDKAEPLYQKMVESKEKSFGACHPAVATAIVNMAVLYSQMGNHTAAEPLYERALKIYEETLDPYHPRVSETMVNMALLKYEQGDFQTAAKLYRRATEIKDNESVSNGKGISPPSMSVEVSATLPRVTNDDKQIDL